MKDWNWNETCKLSGDHKKEDPNNKKSVLSEIKIGVIEELEGENVTKTPDNLEMADLNPAPVPDSDADEEDINMEGEMWIHWNFVDCQISSSF